MFLSTCVQSPCCPDPLPLQCWWGLLIAHTCAGTFQQIYFGYFLTIYPILDPLVGFWQIFLGPLMVFLIIAAVGDQMIALTILTGNFRLKFITLFWQMQFFYAKSFIGVALDLKSGR